MDQASWNDISSAEGDDFKDELRVLIDRSRNDYRSSRHTWSSFDLSIRIASEVSSLVFTGGQADRSLAIAL
jgi:hypothetical protein